MFDSGSGNVDYNFFPFLNVTLFLYIEINAIKNQSLSTEIQDVNKYEILLLSIFFCVIIIYNFPHFNSNTYSA